MNLALQPASPWVVTLSGDTSLLVARPATPALTIVLSAQGAPGAKGDKGEPGTAQASRVVAADAIAAAGLPLAISRATGQALLARADTYTRAFVAGLADGGVAAGFAVGVAGGLITLTDWSAVIGAAQLQPGSTYYLAATGGLSTTAPTLPGQCIVVVGLAIDPFTLNVRPTLPLTL